jgi:hypothetical protein
MFHNPRVITHTPTPGSSSACVGGEIIEKTGYAGCATPAYPVFSSLISSSLKEKGE